MNSTIIREKYNQLVNELQENYNQIKIIDNYDFYSSNSYTIFYLNKNESFGKFSDLWNKNLEETRELDLSYDDILLEFGNKAEDFDYLELGTLDIYTDSQYELEI